MSVTVGPAQAVDLPAILEVLRAAKLPPEGIDGLVATTFVARDGPRLVGTAALELYDCAALLRSVAVDQTLRSQGLGQRLTRAALDLARARGATTVYLITETAGRFFPRFGFAPIDRTQVAPAVLQSVQFTKACPASALVMRLDL